MLKNKGLLTCIISFLILVTVIACGEKDKGKTDNNGQLLSKVNSGESETSVEDTSEPEDGSVRDAYDNIYGISNTPEQEMSIIDIATNGGTGPFSIDQNATEEKSDELKNTEHRTTEERPADQRSTEQRTTEIKPTEQKSTEPTEQRTTGQRITETTEVVHVHKFEPVKEAVNYPEKGHYASEIISPERDEKIYEKRWICNTCGRDITSNITGHGKENAACSGYHSEQVCTNIIHHEAVTTMKWIVDEKAHTEYIIKYYQCNECKMVKDRL